MLPDLFIQRLQKIYPLQYKKILDSYASKRVGSFRINTLKNSDSVLFEFETKGVEVTPFVLIPNVYLFSKDDEYIVKGSDAFYGGKIYLQSISSMLPVLVLHPQPSEKILDVCAAPGSKTTQIASTTSNKSYITALEKNKIRCDKLEYNIRLQGAKNITTHKIDALKFLSDPSCPLFDKILLDAPCSSEGRFDANREKSYAFWNMDIVKRNAELQYQFLLQAVARLKKNGTLIYSTCTLSPEENEHVIQRLLNENDNLTLAPVSLFDSEYFLPGIQSWDGVSFSEEMKTCVRVLPSQLTEGFFIARILKN